MLSPRASKSLGLAPTLLLFVLAVGCGGGDAGDKEAPTPGSGGDAHQGGAAAEPSASGSGGTSGSVGEPDAGGAGESEAGAAGGDRLDPTTPQHAGGAPDAGGVAGAGGVGGAAPELSEDPAYASSVESFEPGDGAGYNESKLPDIVLGPPRGKGNLGGSTDVVSLGAGGEIVLGFGDLDIVDGPGPDLLVFENPFWPGGDATMVFAELGEVSVSEDGDVWHTFPCDTVGDGDGNFPGCAGVTPTLVYDAATLVPLDPTQSGGDAFDLADVGVRRARFVKIRDLETLTPGGNTTGFDLDTVAAIHAR